MGKEKELKEVELELKKKSDLIETCLEKREILLSALEKQRAGKGCHVIVNVITGYDEGCQIGFGGDDATYIIEKFIRSLEKETLDYIDEMHTTIVEYYQNVSKGEQK